MPEDRERQAEERSTAQIAAENWKRCIACRQSIPSDATICSYCRTRQTSENRAPYQQTLKWIGAVALVAGLALTISQLIDPLLHHLTAGTETERLIKKARSEKNLRDYPAAIESYEKALRLRPGDRSAMEEETETSMAWVRDFSATGTNEDEIKKTAGAQLAEIFPILDAGLADATGPRKADILAHIAWGHWLNFHIAEAEIGASVEKTLRDALNIDARNVYANAMLANWLLQNREDLAEVKQRFRIAIDTGKQRAFVRDLQIGGMIYDDSPGVRVELIRVANEMRKNGEAIDKENRRRIVSFDYDLYDEAANDRGAVRTAARRVSCYFSLARRQTRFEQPDPCIHSSPPCGDLRKQTRGALDVSFSARSRVGGPRRRSRDQAFVEPGEDERVPVISGTLAARRVRVAASRRQGSPSVPW